VVALAVAAGLGLAVLLVRPTAQPAPPAPAGVRAAPADVPPSASARAPEVLRVAAPEGSPAARLPHLITPPGAGGEPAKKQGKREPAAELGTGVLSVGGEALLRGEVLIDGTRRGFAPGRFELPVGPHQVEVITPDGQRRSRQVTLTRLHTTTAPLSWVE
jgi:hypothetical protein